MLRKLTILLVCALLTGCGSSSPRFGGDDTHRSAPKGKKIQQGPRFSSAHIEEEKKEDDRKVDPVKVAAKHVSTALPGNAGGGLNNQQMMDVILGYIGTPYQYGGETRSGIDCSAFSQQVFDQAAGIKLPRTTKDQIHLGTAARRESLKFGDLIFFNTTGTNPSHVGIYIGDDLFAHASEAYGVTISSLESTYFKKRFTEARRIVP
ncbi:MAG: NlpC/P60 family protein [Ignavibacteriales bacterium]|nr:NlpC/P60 family protein [Ignavibacteriales bacterium]